METLTMTRPVVLITGGSRGIGAAAARRFARGGWDVAVGYRRSREQAETLAEELDGRPPSPGTYPSGRRHRPWSGRRRSSLAPWTLWCAAPG